MTETEWLACEDSEEAFDLLESRHVLTQRKLRLFEVAYCRRVMVRLPNPLLLDALNVAERFAEGFLTEAELEAAHQASRELEDESALNEEGKQETDALYYAAMAVREATSPDTDEYVAGTPSMIQHAITALAYTFPLAPKDNHEEQWTFFGQVSDSEKKFATTLVREIFGNPFRPVAFDAEWRTSTAVALSQRMSESRDFDAMPILADALQDAGCDNADILSHCRESGTHVRGCWVVDLVLGKA